MLLDNGSPGHPDLVETTLEAFLHVNALDDETEAALRALEVGETFQGDEGAGGRWSMTRLPDVPQGRPAPRTRYAVKVRGGLRPERFDSATEATIWALANVPSWVAWEWVPVGEDPPETPGCAKTTLPDGRTTT